MSQESQPHIVVLGVGNILLHDEGAGVRAVQRMIAQYDFPENVELVDGGVMGLGLMSILERADNVLLFDCVRGGGQPGEIHHFDFSEIPPRVTYKDSLHQVDFVETMSVLPLVAKVPQTTVIGVEPDNMEPWGVELSPVVKKSLDGMLAIALEDLAKLGVAATPKENPQPYPGV